MTSPIFKNFTEDPKLEEFCPGGKPRDDWYVSQTCPDSQLIHHHPPLVYNLAADPFEMYHLPSDSELAKELVTKARELKMRHLDTIPNNIPQQLGIYDMNVNPCCDYPVCSCNKLTPEMEVVQRRAFTKWPAHLPRNKTAFLSPTYEFIPSSREHFRGSLLPQSLRRDDLEEDQALIPFD